MNVWRQALTDGWGKVSAFLSGLTMSAPRPAASRRPAGTSPKAAPSRTSPADVFTPTRPRTGQRALVGRHEEIARIMEAIFDDGAHVVLYAERGRGKTSLTNLASEGFAARGAIVARHVCEAESTFDTIVHGLLADLPSSLLAEKPRPGESIGCTSLLPDRSLRPVDVAAIAQRLAHARLVFVMDEFDRVLDPGTRTRLADTIKLVSDRAIPLSFMIVGVAATLEDIIGQHISIQRNISAIHLPLLEDHEVASMIEKGGEQSGIIFSPDAIAMVVTIARGMPYMAQLLGLRIAQAAMRRGHATVQTEDLKAAIDRLLSETPSSILSAYSNMTDGGDDEEMAWAALGLAEADQDRWGRLSIAQETGSINLGGRHVSTALWLRLRRTSLLAESGEPGLLQFADRSMIYYIQLLAARTRLIGEDQVQQEHALPSATVHNFVRKA